MSRNSDIAKRVVIVGGGTAGWIAAVELAHLIPTVYQEVILIESSEIATIGVGEATIPPFVSFLRASGIDEVDFIRETQATFKLAIRFGDWYAKGHDYFHPFGGTGARLGEKDFYQFWLKARSMQDAAELANYSPAAVMCKKNKFFLPFKVDPQSPVATANYALHLDASLAAKYFRKFAVARGISRIEATVQAVELADSGEINALQLSDGRTITGDLFIDCTGFRALLIGKAMKVGYDDWSNYLPCNRAVAMQSERQLNLKPYTVSHARDAGWSWHIPLQHRTGNGYVYCSDYLSDDEATSSLSQFIDGRAINEPRVIPFLTGKRKTIWHKNCLALGLAGGFLEPLESTAIHLVNQGIQHFLDLRPDLGVTPEKQKSYNDFMGDRYAEIRDFLVLHYRATQRDDTEFWRRCKNIPLPTSLEARLDLYKETGGLALDKKALFRKDSWISVLNGMGLQPDTYAPYADEMDYDLLKQFMQRAESMIQEAVEDLPSHDDFIAQYCASPRG